MKPGSDASDPYWWQYLDKSAENLGGGEAPIVETNPTMHNPDTSPVIPCHHNPYNYPQSQNDQWEESIKSIDQ